MRRYIAYASAFVLVITLIIWGISRFIQPTLPASTNSDIILFFIALLSVAAFLGSFNEAIELFHKIFGRKANMMPQPDRPQSVTTQPTVLIKSAPLSSLVTSPSDAVPRIQPSNILIVTATKTEAQAVLETFSQAASKRWTRQAIRSKTYYSLGTHGGASVYMVQSEAGTATPGGALLTVRQAIQDLCPQAVIMCGLAFGLRPDKQQIGDILVAKQLLFYEPQKVDLERGRIPRGDRTTSADRLLDRFRSGDIDWQGAPTHFGLVVSGETLVNDPIFRDGLLKTEPEAIGGEMEGGGLYAAAREAKADWILVKAICDWGDGKKDDVAQASAARNAAQFVLHVLQLGGWDRSESSPQSSGNQTAAQDLPISQQFISKPSQAQTPPQKSQAQLFSSVGNLKVGRYHHMSCLLPDGNVLIVGGHNEEAIESKVLASAELYRTSSQELISVGRMATRRDFAAAAGLANGTVLVTGGRGENGETLDTAELYNPQTGQFTVVGHMTSPRRGHVAVSLRNGKVLLVGGSFNDTLNTTEIYDPIRNVFTPTGNLNVARLTEHTPNAVLLKDGCVLVAGGYDGLTGEIASIEIYDPNRGVFEDGGNMAVKRAAHTLTVLANGNVLIAGGGGEGHLSPAEVYDPIALRSMLTQPMKEPHFHHTATLLPNGKVLVVGGNSSLVEIYDPETEMFSTLASIEPSRYLHTAVLLPSHQVLLIGGVGSLTNLDLSLAFD